MRDKIDTSKGKLWGRDKEWQLLKDHVYEEDSGPCCEHAIDIGPSKRKAPYAEPDGRYMVPYVVVGKDNDGGYHATALCLICILNMAKKHSIEPD